MGEGFAAEALTVNSSALTAIGNDFGFEAIFGRQLEALARPGDVALGISTSGRSENIVVGLRAAHEAGATVFSPFTTASVAFAGSVRTKSSNSGAAVAA